MAGVGRGAFVGAVGLIIVRVTIGVGCIAPLAVVVGDIVADETLVFFNSVPDVFPTVEKRSTQSVTIAPTMIPIFGLRDVDGIVPGPVGICCNERLYVRNTRIR